MSPQMLMVAILAWMVAGKAWRTRPAGMYTGHSIYMPFEPPLRLVACVGLQSGFSKNKLAAQTLLFEQGGMKQ